MKLKATILSIFLSISVSSSVVLADNQNQLSKDQVAQLLEIAHTCDDNELLEIVSQEESAENFWETALQIGATVVVITAALVTGVQSAGGQEPPVISLGS